MHYIAVLYHVFFPFHMHFSSFFAGLFAFVFHKVLIFNNLGAYKPFFKIGVDNPGSLWG